MTKTNLKERVCAISPDNREIIECVIKAACQYYNVTRDQLIEEHRLANARHLCFYIIKVSTEDVFDYSIGKYFNKKRTAVQYGIGIIDHQKIIYRQVIGNLNAIIEIANNFDKKYPWHLQQINITH